jgi:hypothetical protein
MSKMTIAMDSDELESRLRAMSDAVKAMEQAVIDLVHLLRDSDAAPADAAPADADPA